VRGTVSTVQMAPRESFGGAGSSGLSSASGGHPLDGLEFGFSASGWLMQYQLGVAYALQRHGVADSTARFIGASGGAGVSVGLALNVDAKRCADYQVRCCSHFHENPVKNIWQMGDYARTCLLRTMHDETYLNENLKKGKVSLAITLLPSLKGVNVSKFENNQELVDALMASCCLAPIAGIPWQIQRPNDPETHNQWVIDGGLAQMIPKLSKKTITVSPLYCFDADIKPSRYVPLHWGVYPPPPKVFAELFWLGVSDAMKWLSDNGYSDALLDTKEFTFKMSQDWRGRITPRIPRSLVSCHSSHALTKSVVVNRHVHYISTRDNSSFTKENLLRWANSDSAKSGDPVRPITIPAHAMQDGATVGVLMATVKPMALGIVYFEIASKAVLNAAHGAVAEIETKRRESVKQRQGVLSLRKWVHDGMVGCAAESYKKATEYFDTAMDPKLWQLHLPLAGSSSSAEDRTPIAERFMEKSVAYRVFNRAALW